jgi:hypothetical protein
VECGASLIVTFNLSDFPAVALSRFAIRAIHPDDFVLMLIELDPKGTSEAAERQRRTLKRPPKNQEQYLETLAAQGLEKSAGALRDLLQADEG